MGIEAIFKTINVQLVLGWVGIVLVASIILGSIIVRWANGIMVRVNIALMIIIIITIKIFLITFIFIKNYLILSL